VRQQAFERQHAAFWDGFRALLDDLERPARRRRLDAAAHARLPADYRSLCSHYALARGRAYSPLLVAELQHLVRRGHSRLYRRQGNGLWRAIAFVAGGFPRALRAQARYLWLALILFAGTGLLSGLWCFADGEFIYSILDEEQIASMESMYEPDNERPGRSAERSTETDFVMFGYYIANNIAIGFRTFAGGILFGIGTLFLLVYNGLVIGGVAGHLTAIGYRDTFWSFVSGHGAFELTAIAICGAAGLLLARAVLAPGQHRRARALTLAARPAVELVMGAALMLLLAAFIEAFWSSSGVAYGIKYAVAALLWLLVLAYLGLAGRGGSGPR
jgi:uncharacterized membrane protein SpoIIM required for sporulation